MSLEQNTHLIKSAAKTLGFEYCGIAKAERLDEDSRRLESWLIKGFQGKMSYMEHYFDLRVDPCKLVPGAKSIITLLLNYFPSEKQQNADSPIISKYAYGKDYHEVIKTKLKLFLQMLKDNIGEIHGRGFTDSAPVLEKSWAQKSGLGWIGKNGNLITRQHGSFFFISTLIVDIPLEYDEPFARDYCGTCTKCIDECPTEAILDNKVVDGSRCISYFTIELKDSLIPDSMKGKFQNRLFGCDVCQDVCPWNKFSEPTTKADFTPLPEILNFTTSDWEELTEESFKIIFKDSPLKRSRYAGIKRNLKFLHE